MRVAGKGGTLPCDAQPLRGSSPYEKGGESWAAFVRRLRTWPAVLGAEQQLCMSDAAEALRQLKSIVSHITGPNSQHACHGLIDASGAVSVLVGRSPSASKLNRLMENSECMPGRQRVSFRQTGTRSKSLTLKRPSRCVFSLSPSLSLSLSIRPCLTPIVSSHTAPHPTAATSSGRSLRMGHPPRRILFLAKSRMRVSSGRLCGRSKWCVWGGGDLRALRRRRPHTCHSSRVTASRHQREHGQAALCAALHRPQGRGAGGAGCGARPRSPGARETHQPLQAGGTGRRMSHGRHFRARKNSPGSCSRRRATREGEEAREKGVAVRAVRRPLEKSRTVPCNLAWSIKSRSV